MAMAKIKKGDRVVVLTGKDKGKTGTVAKMLLKKDRVVVEGVNMVTKHQRPTQENPNGGILRQEASLHISNVSHVGDDGKPTRVGIKINDDGSKVRVARRGGALIDR